MLRGGRAVGTAILCTALGISSCTSSAEGGFRTTAPGVSAFPVDVRAANGSVEIASRPARIVSLSATATEDLFAIRAGEQVVAADDQSNYPEDAPTTDLSGYEPNVEAILSYSPDLVVVSGDPGDLEPSLSAAGVPTLVQPAATDLNDAYEQIEELGRATGHLVEARRLVGSMRNEIGAIVGSVEIASPPPLIYHELDDTYFSVTSDTFIGHVYSALGATNIADAAKGAGGGYPQLSAEYIVEANPDLIFLSDVKCCDQTEATVAARPGWSHIAAVRRGAIIELDDDVASRWGPRVVDLFDVVASALSTERAAA